MRELSSPTVHCKNIIAAMLPLVMLAFVAPTRAGLINPPPAIVDLMIMMEATTQDIGYLGVQFGADPSNALNWNGTFDSTGWAWNTSGIYRGQALNLSYTGVYNLAGTIDPTHDAVTWTGTGNYGSDTLTSVGKAVLVDDWSWLTTLAIVGAGVGATIVTGGVEALGSSFAPFFTGEAILVSEDIVTGYIVPTTVGALGVQVFSGVAQAAKADQSYPNGITAISAGTTSDGHSISGTVTVVSEPSSLALLGIGALTGFGFWRRCRILSVKT